MKLEGKSHGIFSNLLSKPQPCDKSGSILKSYPLRYGIERTDKGCYDFYALYGVLGKATAMVMCPKIHVTKDSINGNNEKIAVNRLIMEPSKVNKRENEKRVNDHDDDDDDHHHDDDKPRILGFAEAKGFIFGKGIGFGFFDADSVVIRTPNNGIFSEGTGFTKFGFCYDP